MTTPSTKKRPRKTAKPAAPPKDVVTETPTEDVVPPAPTEDRVVYTIELQIGGLTVSNSGDTMLNALKGLEKPTKIITKGTIKVFHGDRSKELFFMPVQMKRMFYPLAQVTIAKMLAMNL